MYFFSFFMSFMCTGATSFFCNCVTSINVNAWENSSLHLFSFSSNNTKILFANYTKIADIYCSPSNIYSSGGIICYCSYIFNIYKIVSYLNIWHWYKEKGYEIFI